MAPIKALIASVLFSAASAANAAAAQLTMTAKVLPVACTPSISGAGVIDYGDILVERLSATTATALPLKSVDFVVQCDAAATIGFMLINNRADKAVGIEATANDIGAKYAYELMGIGTDSLGKPIGALAGRFRKGSGLVDGTAQSLLYKTPVDTTWKVDASGVWYATGLTYGLGDATTKTLKAGQTFAGTFDVQPLIDKTSNLDLSTEISLDGSFTIEIVYP